MALMDILRGGAQLGAQAAPILGTGIGSLFGAPHLGYGGGRLLGSLLEKLSGKKDMGTDSFASRLGIPPEMAAQQELLQQMRQGSFQPIADEETRRFQQEIIPQLAEQFAGSDALRSSGFRQALSGAGQDLSTRLAGLGSQMELQRQQQLANYLTGQQQLGLGAQQLAQRQREFGQAGLTGAQRFAGDRGSLGLQRGISGIGQTGGSAGFLPQLLSGLASAGSKYFGV